MIDFECIIMWLEKNFKVAVKSLVHLIYGNLYRITKWYVVIFIQNTDGSKTKVSRFFGSIGRDEIAMNVWMCDKHVTAKKT